MRLLLYSLFYVWALFILAPLSLLIPKLRQGLFGRFGLKKRLLTLRSKPLYWFHVASSGEFEQCLPILEAVKKEKNETILLTYFSPSGKKAVELEKKRREQRGAPLPWDFADYSPWDLSLFIKPLLQQLTIKAFISIHREVWPSLLTQLKKQGIPTFLLGTFWPERAQKRLTLIKPWVKLFDQIGTVDEATAQFLQIEMPQSKVVALGDPRIDRVLSRKKDAPVAWESFFKQNTVFVGASLWSEDFEVAKVALDRALAADTNLRLLLVPHDPNDGVSETIYGFFKSKNIPIRYWSSWIESPDTTSHILINRVGFLAELYQMADLVLVGGSFKKRVHNVLEPAAYGCPILTGPHIWNSIEAQELKQRGGLKVCPNSETLSLELLKWLHNEALRKKEAAENLSYLEEKKGAARRYAELII